MGTGAVLFVRAWAKLARDGSWEMIGAQRREQKAHIYIKKQQTHTAERRKNTNVSSCVFPGFLLHTRPKAHGTRLRPQRSQSPSGASLRPPGGPMGGPRRRGRKGHRYINKQQKHAAEQKTFVPAVLPKFLLHTRTKAHGTRLRSQCSVQIRSLPEASRRPVRRGSEPKARGQGPPIHQKATTNAAVKSNV